MDIDKTKKKSLGTVSYYHKDGTLHKASIQQDDSLLVTGDPKIVDGKYNNTIEWLKELDSYLPTVMIPSSNTNSLTGTIGTSVYDELVLDFNIECSDMAAFTFDN